MTEKESASESLAVTNDTVTAEPSHDKSLPSNKIEKSVTAVTAKSENREENSSDQQPAAQPEPQKETRLGHMPLDQMWDEIRQVCPNTRPCTDPKPTPKPDPGPPLDPEPELPF